MRKAKLLGTRPWIKYIAIRHIILFITMRKNIAIAILSITTILSFIHSFSQKTIAEQNLQEAIMQKELAERTMVLVQEAEMQAQLEAERAKIAERSALVAMTKAQEALERCK